MKKSWKRWNYIISRNMLSVSDITWTMTRRMMLMSYQSMLIDIILKLDIIVLRGKQKIQTWVLHLKQTFLTLYWTHLWFNVSKQIKLRWKTFEWYKNQDIVWIWKCVLNFEMFTNERVYNFNWFVIHSVWHEDKSWQHFFICIILKMTLNVFL